MSVTQLLGPGLLAGSFLSHDTIGWGPQSCFWILLTPLWKRKLLQGPPKSQLCFLYQGRSGCLPSLGLSACSVYVQVSHPPWSRPLRLCSIQAVRPKAAGSQSRNQLETWGHNCATAPKSETQHASDGWGSGAQREATCSEAAWRGRARILTQQLLTGQPGPMRHCSRGEFRRGIPKAAFWGFLIVPRPETRERVTQALS